MRRAGHLCSSILLYSIVGIPKLIPVMQKQTWVPIGDLVADAEAIIVLTR
jgi:hypothetical protein